MSGFLNQDKNAQGWPVDLAVDQTGALLVADDVGGIVESGDLKINCAPQSLSGLRQPRSPEA